MRSIKFPLPLVRKIFKLFIKTIIDTKTIDIAAFQEVENSIITENGFTKGKNITKTAKESNFKRKLNHFLRRCKALVERSYKECVESGQGEEIITSTLNSTTTVSEFNNVTVSVESLSHKVISNFFKKSAACYLRFEDIQKLKELNTI